MECACRVFCTITRKEGGKYARLRRVKRRTYLIKLNTLLILCEWIYTRITLQTSKIYKSLLSCLQLSYIILLRIHYYFLTTLQLILVSTMAFLDPTELYTPPAHLDQSQQWPIEYNYPAYQCLQSTFIYEGDDKSVAFHLMYATGRWDARPCYNKVDGMNTAPKIYRAIIQTYNLEFDLSKDADRTLIQELVVLFDGGVTFKPTYDNLTDMKPYAVHIQPKIVRFCRMDENGNQTATITARMSFHNTYGEILRALQGPLQVTPRTMFAKKASSTSSNFDQITHAQLGWANVPHNKHNSDDPSMNVYVKEGDHDRAGIRDALQAPSMAGLSNEERVAANWRDLIPDMCFPHNTTTGSFTEMQPDWSTLHLNTPRRPGEDDSRYFHNFKEWKQFHEYAHGVQEGLVKLSDLTQYKRPFAMSLLRHIVDIRQETTHGTTRNYRQAIAPDINKLVVCSLGVKATSDVLRCEMLEGLRVKWLKMERR
ncbi:hypothetical protein EJ08DRAFT_410676 [Tothia fuscella]|uniref:Uncharacterized protein n=1 Tax=Tothia fuscella TaxID=1048955 RepID=A0A9P4NKK1_9PEZI|nr:hypothetical protein EJ08DRAFT_410676 [Tothia fuscella]